MIFKDSNYAVFRGDNNRLPDPFLVLPGEILGRVDMEKCYS